MADVSLDISLDLITLNGGKRCVNEKSLHSAILAPEPALWARSRKALIKQQLKALGRDKLLENYVELMVRCQKLLDYMEDNVGQDCEWPVLMLFESDESNDLLDSLLEELQASVGYLTEI